MNEKKAIKYIEGNDRCYGGNRKWIKIMKYIL